MDFIDTDFRFACYVAVFCHNAHTLDFIPVPDPQMVVIIPSCAIAR